MHEYGLKCLPKLNGNRYEAVILAVAHDQFQSLHLRTLGSCSSAVVYDVKGILKLDEVDGRL